MMSNPPPPLDSPPPSPWSNTDLGAGRLFQLLRNGAPWSRTDLVQASGLSRSTVNERLTELFKTGLVGTSTPVSSTGGRPSATVSLIPQAKVVLVASFGASSLTVGALDLVNKPLASTQVALDIAIGPEKALGTAKELFDSVLEDLNLSCTDVVAVGVGLPGPVHFETGRPSRPPIMTGWDNFDVPGWFSSHFNAPVIVDNDVNILALGEFTRTDQAHPYMMVIKIATGIGAGIISSGHIQRGAHGIAGDIGHIRIERATGKFCHCGNEGCLEAIASGAAIAQTLREQGIESAHNSCDVVNLVGTGNLHAINAVRQAGRDLGEALAAGISLLNPQAICIAGAMAQVGEHLLAGIREVVSQRTMPLAAQNLHIYTIADAEDTALLGAGALALDSVLSTEAIASLVSSC